MRKRKYDLYKLAIKNDPKAIWDLAVLSKNTGDKLWARKWFNEASQINSKYLASALVNLGSMDYRSKRVDKALEKYIRAAKLGSTIASWNIAYIYESQGHMADAINWYEYAAQKGHPQAKRRFEKFSSRPTAKLINSPRQAEVNAKNWLFYWGHRDAVTTTENTTSDGGIDVESSRAVVQVKFEQSKTGRPAVQKLYGAAAPSGKNPIFFSYAGYSRQAYDYCEQMEIAIFQYDEYGVPSAINSYAQTIVQNYK